MPRAVRTTAENRGDHAVMTSPSGDYTPLSWVKGGLLLGLVFFAAVALVKPIGVSTQFVIFDGILWDAINPDVVVSDPVAKSGYSSSNSYLNKSGGKYAASIARPLNYSFVFVIALMGGALLSAILRGGVPPSERMMPAIWRSNWGGSFIKRFVAAFAAGFLVLYGARLAGGCTSGHMMSGMMQTALSGFIFSAGVFLAGIPLALKLFSREA
jgi:uncharacterized protein